MTGRTDGPDLLALLPAAVAARYTTRSVLAGHERPPVVALHRAATPLPDEARWSAAPVRDLVEEAMARFEGRRTRADAWLAPRLHATLRMTRAEASDGALWNHLALAVAPDYVVWRHLGLGDREDRAVSAARFTGPHYSQAFARLWWAAEMFRDGDDYRPAEVACGNQDVLNTTMRLDVIDHRPTAQAVVRILARLTSEGVTRLGDRVNALSAAVNVAASTIVYDAVAPDDLPDADPLVDWIAESRSAAPVPWESLPEGPEDGRTRKASVDTLVELFEGLLAEAPLRQRKGENPEDAQAV